MYRIGVDLGGTNIAVGLVNEENGIVCRTMAPTRASLGAETVIEDIADCIHNALVLSGLDTADCRGTAPLPEIRPAALGGDAGIIGAAALADDA